MVGWEECFKRFTILLILAFLVIVNAQNLQVPQWYQEYEKQIKESWEKYQPIGMVAVLLSFLVASLLYAFGIALNNEKLKNYGNAEFLEAVASLLMVGFFLTLLQILVSVTFPVPTNAGIPEQVTIAKVGPFVYLDSRLFSIQQLANKTYIAIVKLLYPLYFLTSIEIQIPAAKYAETATSAIQTILYALITPLYEIAEYIFSGMKAISFQRAILAFFRDSALTVLLPLGVILRIFPPTRGAGGMLIAMAYSFFFIFPFVYLIFYAPSPTTNVYQELMKNLQALNQQLDKINSDPVLTATRALMNVGAGILSIILVVIQIFLAPVGFGLFGQIINLLSSFTSFYATYLFVLQLLPVIAAAVSLTFMRILSDLFGENAVDYWLKPIMRII